ncbi:expressed unknown protein [Seminavis robusta]|uniref:DUF4116 domain-containing protein n=1 Tax=Seminavis robusta TaxID=568900 RepID=A0A9N8HRI3_9STRA|nr:expressed unknown protein [Seminavis robusta]|eukprot:Sro1274_g258430.1 n/a (803) ;mRNA; r:28107-30630
MNGKRSLSAGTSSGASSSDANTQKKPRMCSRDHNSTDGSSAQDDFSAHPLNAMLRDLILAPKKKWDELKELVTKDGLDQDAAFLLHAVQISQGRAFGLAAPTLLDDPQFVQQVLETHTKHAAKRYFDIAPIALRLRSNETFCVHSLLPFILRHQKDFAVKEQLKLLLGNDNNNNDKPLLLKAFQINQQEPDDKLLLQRNATHIFAIASQQSKEDLEVVQAALEYGDLADLLPLVPSQLLEQVVDEQQLEDLVRGNRSGFWDYMPEELMTKRLALIAMEDDNFEPSEWLADEDRKWLVDLGMDELGWDEEEVVELVSDRMKALLRVREDPDVYSDLEDEYKDDVEIAEECGKRQLVSQHGSERIQLIFQLQQDASVYTNNATLEQQEDRDVAMAAMCSSGGSLVSKAAVRRNSKVYAILSSSASNKQLADLQLDSSIAMVAIREDINLANQLPTALWNTKDFVLKAIGFSSGLLQYAADAIKDDKDIVLEAVKTQLFALKYAGPSVLSDREFYLESLPPRAFQYLSEELRGDPDLVLRAVEKCWEWILQHASPKLCADPVFMRRAIAIRPMALKFASKEIQGDRDIVLTAIQGTGDDSKEGNPVVFQGASQELKADREVALQALKGGKVEQTMGHVDKSLWSQDNFVLDVLRVWPLQDYQLVMARAGPGTVNDPNFMAQAVEISSKSPQSLGVWKRSAGSVLKARFYKAVKALKSTDRFPDVEAVQCRAMSMIRVAAETLWCVKHVTASLPAEVQTLVWEYSAERSTQQTKFQRAVALKFCGPIFVVFSKKQVNWKDFQQKEV